MKIGSESREVTVSEAVTGTRNFKIKATAKAFKILSDGLYSDKILAVIRELACNAYDAHVAAGHPEKPFYLHLPDELDPVFRLRDFGIGLSYHDIHHVYTTYFESLKTHSNDMIGALGLRSKSPFAYVDSFTVNSYFNGELRTYAAYLDEDGCPAVADLGAWETDEPNGLEIMFPVEKNDKREKSHPSE